MKTKIEIKEMAEANDIKPRSDAGVDMYEDANGNLINKSQIVEMIEEENEMECITFPLVHFKYHQGAYPPEWFDKSKPNHYDITSGTSLFNEWYGFENEGAIHLAACDFISQTFVDAFIFVDCENRFYHLEDVMTYGIDQFKPKENASPADARSMLEAESPF